MLMYEKNISAELLKSGKSIQELSTDILWHHLFSKLESETANQTHHCWQDLQTSDVQKLIIKYFPYLEFTRSEKYQSNPKELFANEYKRYKEIACRWKIKGGTGGCVPPPA